MEREAQMRENWGERERDTVCPKCTVLAGFLCDSGHPFSIDLRVSSMIWRRGEWTH